MRWLIDGYNVIRRDADLRAAEARSLAEGRAALLHLLAPVARALPDEFTVVFDGEPGRGTPSPGVPGQRVRAVFSRPPEKADDVLVRLARTERERAIVVTSDRAVADAARRAGCVALGAEEFLAGLEGQGPDDLDEAEEARGVKRGNPRRLSREARAARRALGRLRAPGNR